MLRMNTIVSEFLSLHAQGQINYFHAVTLILFCTMKRLRINRNGRLVQRGE